MRHLKSFKIFESQDYNEEFFKNEMESFIDKTYHQFEFLYPVDKKELILQGSNNLFELICEALFTESRLPDEDLLDSEYSMFINKMIIVGRNCEQVYENGGELREVFNIFKMGIIKSLFEFLENINSGISSEEENEIEKIKSKPKDYSKMSKSELNDEVNRALDEEDWNKLDDLRQYLKESVVSRKLFSGPQLKEFLLIVKKYLENIKSKKR